MKVYKKDPDSELDLLEYDHDVMDFIRPKHWSWIGVISISGLETLFSIFIFLIFIPHHVDFIFMWIEKQLNFYSSPSITNYGILFGIGFLFGFVNFKTIRFLTKQNLKLLNRLVNYIKKKQKS